MADESRDGGLSRAQKRVDIFEELKGTSPCSSKTFKQFAQELVSPCFFSVYSLADCLEELVDEGKVRICIEINNKDKPPVFSFWLPA